MREQVVLVGGPSDRRSFSVLDRPLEINIPVFPKPRVNSYEATEQVLAPSFDIHHYRRATICGEVLYAIEGMSLDEIVRRLIARYAESGE